MAIQSIVWTWTILMWFAQVKSMPTCQLQGNLLKAMHHLLRDMGGNFPVQCLQDNVAITFPASAFNASDAQQLGEGARSIYQILKSIDSLFGEKELPTEWDKLKLDDFLSVVYRQIEESRCMSGSPEGEALKAYFDRLAALLTEKNSSFCAWEVVRQKLLYTLQYILQTNSNNFLSS